MQAWKRGEWGESYWLSLKCIQMFPFGAHPQGFFLLKVSFSKAESLSSCETKPLECSPHLLALFIGVGGGEAEPRWRLAKQAHNIATLHFVLTIIYSSCLPA